MRRSLRSQKVCAKWQNLLNDHRFRGGHAFPALAILSPVRSTMHNYSKAKLRRCGSPVNRWLANTIGARTSSSALVADPIFRPALLSGFRPRPFVVLTGADLDVRAPISLCPLQFRVPTCFRCQTVPNSAISDSVFGRSKCIVMPESAKANSAFALRIFTYFTTASPTMV
jgi:hypothetical protein